jgi:hypothetical protein
MIWLMWEAYQEVVRKYPRLPLEEERRLIALAQAGRKESSDELVLRHLGFLMWRLRRRVFRPHLERHGEDLLSAAIPVLYEKVGTYNLDYLKREGRAGGVPYDDTRLFGPRNT